MAKEAAHPEFDLEATCSVLQHDANIGGVVAGCSTIPRSSQPSFSMAQKPLFHVSSKNARVDG